MQDYFLDQQGVLNLGGTRMPFHPQTGETWTEKLVESYVAQLVIEEVEEPAQAAEMAEIYAGFIQVTDVVVKEGSGEKIATPEATGFAETTVTKGSVVCLSAKVLADKDDEKSVKTDLAKSVFRIPVLNQQSRERELFVGILDKGLLTVEAPMEKAGYWQVSQDLINEKLAKGTQFEMPTMVFAVVNTTADTLVKLKD